jgi:iron(III) transport system ATP-binding protein
MKSVAITDLRKRFGSRKTVEAIASVSFAIDEGELLVLLGPSGCGKSTILRSVAGLERPDEGRIEIGGEVVFDADRGINVRSQRRDLGMVFQSYALWPHMTVLENVVYPLRARGRRDLIKSGRAMEVLKSVECDELAGRYPSQLSGGQQQRVALARALSCRPTLMLLDEPLSNLDARLRYHLRDEIRRIHHEIGFTGLYVTHDQREAAHLADRLVIMNAGSILQVGTPTEVFRAPASPYVAKFLGIDNMIPVSSLGVDDESETRWPQDGAIWIHPDHVHVESASAQVRAPGLTALGGVLEDTAFDGETTEAKVRIGGSVIRARGTYLEKFNVGASVSISLDPEHIHLFVGDARIESRGIGAMQ